MNVLMKHMDVNMPATTLKDLFSAAAIMGIG